MIKTLLNKIYRKKKGENFFELSAKDKKKIINAATKGSNELQSELVKEYNKKFAV